MWKSSSIAIINKILYSLLSCYKVHQSNCLHKGYNHHQPLFTGTFGTTQFSIFASPTLHSVCPRKFCIQLLSYCLQILLGKCSTLMQEHLKTNVYAKFGVQTECIMGDSKIVNAQLHPITLSQKIKTTEILTL